MYLEGIDPQIIPDTNKELLSIKGEIENDEIAKLTLARFLRHNLKFTFNLLLGTDEEFNLYPFQEILLRAWFRKSNSLNILGRGGSKSTLIAVFCTLFPLFNPDSEIVVVSSNFRNARDIFAKWDRWHKSPRAVFLRQCFSTNPVRRNDLYEIKINGGVVKFVPSSNDNLRGLRASVLICDELRLIGEETLDNVLFPLLSTPTGSEISRRKKIRALEDRLIKIKRMKEEDRMNFADKNKFIGLSSASFEFEHLFKMFCKYEDIILHDKENARNHFISQIGFDGVPRDMVSKQVLDAAAAGATENPVFMREYGARFTNDSQGWYSAKKMQECTLPTGELPTTQIKGREGTDYILSIDPSYSSEKNSDDFAMKVLQINYNNKTTIDVHNYAKAGGELKEHIFYLHYIITHFNIVYIITDSTGHGENFINAANESLLFKQSNICLKSFNAEFDDKDYIASVARAKETYNLTNRVIVHPLIFNSKIIHNMNEHLVYCFNLKKTWFASKAAAFPVVFEKMAKTELPFKWEEWKGPDYNILEFIRDQDDFIDETKKQCSLIVAKINPATNIISYDLPTHLRKLTGDDRPRRDSFSALLMGCWAAKCYFDMQDFKDDGINTFAPFMS